MNLFSPILRLFNSGTLSNPDVGYQVGAVEKTSTASGTNVSDARALKIGSVWACVQLIANSVAGMPLDFYKQSADGPLEKITRKNALGDLLQKSPNQLMKPRDFRLAMTVQMALWNNAYAEIVWNTEGTRPVALMPLRPGRMAPFITPDGTLTYHYSVNQPSTHDSQNGIKVYAKKQILHLKGFGTDGVVGAERNNYARETYGLSVSAEEFAAKQFANGGRPGGVIEFSEFLTKEQRTQVRELYEGISEGSVNANKLWILEGGSNYNALNFTADQMQMIATRQHQVSDVCRFFGVPEVMINSASSMSNSWPASLEQQLIMFLEFTLKPYLDEWETALTAADLVKDPNVVADHDSSAFIKMDSTARANFFSTLVQNGLMSRNEARIKLGLPRVDGGDELTAQVNLAPLDVLGEKPEPPDTDAEQAKFFNNVKSLYSELD